MDCEVTTGKASCPLAAGYLYLLRRYNPPEPTNLYPLLLHTVIDFPGGYVAESQFSQPLSNPTIQYAVYTVYSNPTNSIDQSIDQVYLQGPSHLQPLTSHSTNQQSTTSRNLGYLLGAGGEGTLLQCTLLGRNGR